MYKNDPVHSGYGGEISAADQRWLNVSVACSRPVLHAFGRFEPIACMVLVISFPILKAAASSRPVSPAQANFAVRNCRICHLKSPNDSGLLIVVRAAMGFVAADQPRRDRMKHKILNGLLATALGVSLAVTAPAFAFHGGGGGMGAATSAGWGRPLWRDGGGHFGGMGGGHFGGMGGGMHFGGVGGGMHFGGVGGGMRFGGMGGGPRFGGMGGGPRFGAFGGGARFGGARFATARFAGAPFAAHAAFAPRFSSFAFRHNAFHHAFFRHRFHRFNRFAFVGVPFAYASYGYYDGCWRNVWTAYGPQWVNVCGDYWY
jgi:hypothetical protein